MTVTYNAEVATSRYWNFVRLIFRWRGSLLKLVLLDLVVFGLLYAICSVSYRMLMNENQRKYFEKVCLYSDYLLDNTPMTFILGFYVNVIYSRWWNVFVTIPWPDKLALTVTANLHGLDDRAKMMRRSIMRYANLAMVLAMTNISAVVKKRFPSLEHLVAAGFMTDSEKIIFEEHINQKIRDYPAYFVPLIWSTSLIYRARKENKIPDDYGMKSLYDEVSAIRASLGMIFCYDWINVPLVYTQAVTLSVYSYALATVFSSQFLDTEENYEKHSIDLYVPFYSLLQLTFYLGWLKAAECMINPFGEDDDDFDLNSIIDRNLHYSYMVVDEMHAEHPELIQDKYWDEGNFALPYTIASMPFAGQGAHMGSVANYTVPEKDQEILILDDADNPLDEKDLAPQTQTDLPMEESHVDDRTRLLLKMENGNSRGRRPQRATRSQLNLPTSSNIPMTQPVNIHRYRRLLRPRTRKRYHLTGSADEEYDSSAFPSQRSTPMVTVRRRPSPSNSSLSWIMNFRNRNVKVRRREPSDSSRSDRTAIGVELPAQTQTSQTEIFAMTDLDYPSLDSRKGILTKPDSISTSSVSIKTGPLSSPRLSEHEHVNEELTREQFRDYVASKVHSQLESHLSLTENANLSAEAAGPVGAAEKRPSKLSSDDIRLGLSMSDLGSEPTETTQKLRQLKTASPPELSALPLTRNVSMEFPVQEPQPTASPIVLALPAASSGGRIDSLVLGPSQMSRSGPDKVFIIDERSLGELVERRLEEVLARQQQQQQEQQQEQQKEAEEVGIAAGKADDADDLEPTSSSVQRSDSRSASF